MIYKAIQPSLYLKDYVIDYLLLHYVFDVSIPVPVKPFPANTQHCLVFYLQGEVTAVETGTGLSNIFPKTAINGSQISRFDFHLTSNYLMLSVNFQPGALTKFLKLPLNDFTNTRIDAEAVLSPKIHQVHERMANAGSIDCMVKIVEDYLWARIQKLKPVWHPMDNIAQILSVNPHYFNAEKLAGMACLSISQFERKFMQQIGITPKFYARINRFYHAYQIKDKNPNADWLGIALETGYHDYQHMVKDFKQFSHTSPNALLKAQALSPERIFGIG